MAQVVGCLPTNHQALSSSIPSIKRKKERMKEGRKEGRSWEWG
jgi:hypothetical protein